MIKLRTYLEGTRFTARTDQDALRWILNLSDATDQAQRWQLCVSEFAFDIVHPTGITHQVADALS